MKREIDDLLKHALTPSEEPGFGLNQNLLRRAEEETSGMKNGFHRISIAMLVTVLVLGISSITAYAAWKYLTPDKVAEEMRESTLAQAFKSEEAVWINETQSYGGYNVTFLGIVSGEALSGIRMSEGEVLNDATYVVVAIENADGTPMPETTEDAYSEQDFFISPLIKGYNPKDYNAITMHGSATTIVENGVLYRLVVCDNVEIFADCGLYMCVLDQTFYSSDYYIYDEETGEISRNEAYGGLNALFALPIDSAKGNPQKAAAYIESLGIVETAKQQERVDKVELEQSEIAEEDSVGVQVAEFALQFVGTPYEWGGTSLPEGVDCSGFVKSVYEEFGVILPHSAVQDMEEGETVAGLENALPGDLIIYENPSHVGIYIGDGKIVHVDTKFGVCIAEVEYAEISVIRRVVLEK